METTRLHHFQQKNEQMLLPNSKKALSLLPDTCCSSRWCSCSWKAPVCCPGLLQAQTSTRSQVGEHAPEHYHWQLEQEDTSLFGFYRSDYRDSLPELASVSTATFYWRVEEAPRVTDIQSQGAWLVLTPLHKTSSRCCTRPEHWGKLFTELLQYFFLPDLSQESAWWRTSARCTSGWPTSILEASRRMQRQAHSIVLPASSVGKSQQEV